MLEQKLLFGLFLVLTLNVARLFIFIGGASKRIFFEEMKNVRHVQPRPTLGTAHIFFGKTGQPCLEKHNLFWGLFFVHKSKC